MPDPDKFEKDLARVLVDLEKRLVDIAGGAQTSKDAFDAAAILNSRPAMLQALNDSGYYDLASGYVADYPSVVDEVKRLYKSEKLPAPRFTEADRDTFRQLARADFEQFAFIGERALDDLRLGLYKQTIIGLPLSMLTESIKESTVGLAANNSPLANYAATHARTAVSSFYGDVSIAAGESIGAELWRVQGPEDGKTREVCEQALDNPVRTKEQWEAAGYWGGSPGGWNCRHYFVPVFEVF